MHLSYLALTTVTLFILDYKHAPSPACNIFKTAARMSTYTKRSAHITPILFNLHWLPVSSRIIYTSILLIFTVRSYTYLSLWPNVFHILLLVYLDHLEGNFSVFQDITFHLWEGDLSLCYGSYMIELIAPVSPVNNHTARIQTQIESVQPTLSVIICFFLNCLWKALYKLNVILLLALLLLLLSSVGRICRLHM